MKNKTILVTGATAGIGKALAQSLSAQGARVIITGRDQDKVSRVSDAIGCTGFVADSANIAQIQQLADALQRDQVRLDGLVLNAGVFYPEAVASTSEEAFNLTMNINTKGPFFTLQKLQPLLNNPASVVFVSSIAVTRGFANAAVYAASKAAFEAMARVANLEFADKGIRINSVRPGVTATDIQAKAGMTATQQSELFNSLDETVLGRVMTPADQIGAIEFLLSDASLAMRSAIIEVDGGYQL